MRGPALDCAGRRLLILAVLAALAGAGCAGLFSRYDVAPNGLPRNEARLRQDLAFGRADSALARLTAEKGGAPEDDLLRALYAGILAHYAGAYDSSSAALQRAAELAEDRYTKRVSRAALSLITSDNVLPYEPGWTERLLIHFYGALNYLRRGDREGAAVEARRLAFLLEREAERKRDDRTTPLLATLRYFSGVVFEAAGERNDADVAYRNAFHLLGRSDSVPAPPDSLGTVVVIVEQGFVAHRVEQSIVTPLHPIEVEWLTQGDGEERAVAAAEIAARVVAEMMNRQVGRPYFDRRPSTIYVGLPPDHYYERLCEEALRKAKSDDGQRNGTARKKRECPGRGENPYLLRIAWPAFRLDREPATGLRIVAGDTAAPLAYRASVTDAVIRDFDEERTLLIARTIARAASKMALTKGIEKNVGKGDDAWIGRLLGAVTNVGTAILEQADTRSWQLLPGQIGIARLHLPAGTHDIVVEVPAGGQRRQISAGRVTVRAGEITVLPIRIWQ